RTQCCNKKGGNEAYSAQQSKRRRWLFSFCQLSHRRSLAAARTVWSKVSVEQALDRDLLCVGFSFVRVFLIRRERVCYLPRQVVTKCSWIACPLVCVYQFMPDHCNPL